MVNDKEKELEAQKESSGHNDALQGQLGNILSGVERSLAVTCESIMGQMKKLEDKIQDMERRYSELAKDAEKALNEAGETNETKSAGENAPPQKWMAI